ncbi:MAG: hypothetical protein NT170_00655 [Candidatus Moranbacteria bacterium]|nr:hypothetical protein [Candidatus Moranbacteria bacterium]
MSRLEKKRITDNMAKIRAENRSAIANTIAARVLNVLASSPNLEDGIPNSEIAEVLRKITDNEIDFNDKLVRQLDFENLDDLINEVDPLIRRGLAKMRGERKSAA